MDIYKSLNECTKYIENNLDGEIDYNIVAKIFGFNISTVKKVFSLITGISLNEYIRRRKLTKAVYDIKNNMKIIDVAYKYGYLSDASFSRSFKKMHGILPSKVKTNDVTLNMQPILIFNDSGKNNNLSYRIVNLDKIVLYGVKQVVDVNGIPPVADKLWTDVKNKYEEFKISNTRYAVIKKIDNEYYYYVALEKEINGLEKIVIPSCKWLVLKSKSFKGREIEKLFNTAYDEYVPSLGFDIKKDFELELEKYYKDYMEIYIKIN